MKTFEDFYYQLTDDEKAITDQLKQIVLSTAPGFREKISYGVPYYFLHTRVCYIWPASVKPGPRSGVVLGFCQGQLLSEEHTMLERENRKIIATITFHSLKEIKPAILKRILYEAILIDEETAKMKKTKGRKGKV
jgi:hypothetical protein